MPLAKEHWGWSRLVRWAGFSGRSESTKIDEARAAATVGRSPIMWRRGKICITRKRGRDVDLRLVLRELFLASLCILFLLTRILASFIEHDITPLSPPYAPFFTFPSTVFIKLNVAGFLLRFLYSRLSNTVLELLTIITRQSYSNQIRHQW